MAGCKSVDEVLQLTGGFGRYQFKLLASLCYMMTILGLQGLTMTFLTLEPPWQCRTTSMLCNITNSITLSSKSLYKKRCAMDKTTDWEFTDSFTSAVTEFNWYCDTAMLKTIASSMVYLGWLIGAIMFGILSDKYGRKAALFSSMTLMSWSAFATSFVSVTWLFVILRFFVGMGIGGGMLCIFVLSAEFAGPKCRSFAGTVLWCFWTVALMLIALMAYLIRDWRKLSLATSIPGLPIIFLWWLVPESTRWNLTHGKITEAERTFSDISIVNRVKVDEKNLRASSIVIPKTNESGNPLHLFHSLHQTKITLICWFAWLTCSMMYYGISMSAGNLGGSIYLNFFLISLVEIPANILAIYIMNRFGRKKPIFIAMFGVAIGLLGAAAFPRSNTHKGYMAGRVILAALAKFSNLIAFDAVYITTFELYPTTVRNVAMGTSSAIARIGSFSSTYIVYLYEFNHFLPFVVMGGFALTSAILTRFLPETNNIPTKETMSNTSSGILAELEEDCNIIPLQDEKKPLERKLTSDQSELIPQV